MFTLSTKYSSYVSLSLSSNVYDYGTTTLPATPPYTITYKNTYLLRIYIGITGKILPRYITKLSAKEHRLIAKSIRRSRRVGLIPLVWSRYASQG